MRAPEFHLAQKLFIFFWENNPGFNCIAFYKNFIIYEYDTEVRSQNFWSSGNLLF
jgi:hypothetical protein